MSIKENGLRVLHKILHSQYISDHADEVVYRGSLYTQLQKKVYTFRFVEYSEGIGPGFQGIISFEYS